MTTDQLAAWAVAHPWLTALTTTALSVLIGIVSWRIERTIRAARRRRR